VNTYLIWLEWPERCFRANDGDLKLFRSLVPKGSRVVRVKSEQAFLKALPSATHAVVWHFNKEWFARAPKLKVLATPAAGRELVAWRDAPKGVKVHFGSFHGPIISETVLGFLLAWTRGFFWKGPMWPREELAEHCGDLEGTTAVIAGFGRIGRAIAACLEPFGVECFGITRRGIFTLKNFHEGRSTTEKIPSPLLRRADWFILALPSDTETDDFLDARLIRRLPKKCVVVNVGRGNAVDEDALLAAIKEGRLAGAYLDVYKQEPTALNPKIGPRGKGLAAAKSVPWNLVRMPHACAFSSRYMKECFRELAREGVLK
jgi:phosphoglycerate dehydrogenase-like enzyme